MADQMPDVPKSPPPAQKSSAGNRTLVIVLIVLLVLCCCCLCIASVIYLWQNGDQIFGTSALVRALLAAL